MVDRLAEQGFTGAANTRDTSSPPCIPRHPTTAERSDAQPRLSRAVPPTITMTTSETPQRGRPQGVRHTEPTPYRRSPNPATRGWPAGVTVDLSRHWPWAGRAGRERVRSVPAGSRVAPQQVPKQHQVPVGQPVQGGLALG